MDTLATGGRGSRRDAGSPVASGRLARALTVGAVIWVAILFAAPVALARGHVPVLTLATYQAGSLICHQRPERSFHVTGVQMPVCARCFGLYLSGALGLLLASVRSPRFSRRMTRGALALAAIPIAVTVALEWGGVITTSNVARLLTGLPLGLVAGLVIVGALAPAPAARVDAL